MTRMMMSTNSLLLLLVLTTLVSQTSAGFQSKGYIQRKHNVMTKTELGPNYPASKSTIHPAPKFKFKDTDTIKTPRKPNWVEASGLEKQPSSTSTSSNTINGASPASSSTVDVSAAAKTVEKTFVIPETVPALEDPFDDPFYVGPPTVAVSETGWGTPVETKPWDKAAPVKKQSRVRRFFKAIKDFLI